MSIKKNIEALLESKISNYRISKATGIAQTTLGDYTTGKSKIGNMKLDHAITLNDFYINNKEEFKMKMWNRDSYTVEMIEHDADLKAFEVTQGDNIQTIYPATIEDMEMIIAELDAGEDVDGWEDGMGNTISVD